MRLIYTLNLFLAIFSSPSFSESSKPRLKIEDLNRLSVRQIGNTAPGELLQFKASELAKLKSELLVELLGSPKYRLRELADEALIAQGTQALAALNARNQDRDLEIQNRVLHLLDKIVPPPVTAQQFSERIVETLKARSDIRAARKLLSQIFQEMLPTEHSELKKLADSKRFPQHDISELLLYEPTHDARNLKDQDKERYLDALTRLTPMLVRTQTIFQTILSRLKYQVASEPREIFKDIKSLDQFQAPLYRRSLSYRALVKRDREWYRITLFDGRLTLVPCDGMGRLVKVKLRTRSGIQEFESIPALTTPDSELRPILEAGGLPEDEWQSMPLPPQVDDYIQAAVPLPLAEDRRDLRHAGFWEMLLRLEGP